MKEYESLETQNDSGEERFLSRWSRRKQAADQPLAERDETAGASAEPAQLTDADMPPLESLDENADYSGFLSPKVSDGLRQLALQKLFHSACFNVCDGLDDYADDYTSFEKLGDVMTADLRFRLQQEAERAAEKLQAETADATPDTPQEVLHLADEAADVDAAQAGEMAPQTVNNDDPDSEEITA